MVRPGSVFEGGEEKSREGLEGGREEGTEGRRDGWRDVGKGRREGWENEYLLIKYCGHITRSNWPSNHL